MIIEEKVHINVPPNTVHTIYTEVENWHRWDPDTKSARLDGPFAVGTTGVLAPTQGFPVKMKVTEVAPERGFTVECRAPLCVMRFDHELTPDGVGVIALHRLVFSGPLAWLFGRLVGSRVRLGLPVTMQSLKRYAEQRHSAVA
jgi:hypothetical protein